MVAVLVAVVTTRMGCIGSVSASKRMTGLSGFLDETFQELQLFSLQLL